MEKDDEAWLLSSIARAWDKVRIDVGKGYIWSEQDTISSFYRHLMQLLVSEDPERPKTLGNLSVQTELGITRPRLRVGTKTRFIDLAIVRLDYSPVEKDTPFLEPSQTLVHFEFKYGWIVPKSNVRRRLVRDIKKLMTGNEPWKMKNRRKRWDANTDFIVLCLIANKWDSCTRNGILHPNGEDGHPLLEDLEVGQRYFELHGPFSVLEDNKDYIKGNHNRWGFFEITRDGQKKKIQSQ